MNKIKSFQLNHDTHKAGFYLSSQSKAIFTYDMRFKTPNKGDYITPAAAHTIEHMFATVIRNSEAKDNVVYFGPMGCRTGFYLLLRNIEPKEAKTIVVNALKDCLLLNNIPGNKKAECGNYRSHDMLRAKTEIKNYLTLLQKVSCETIF